MRRGRTVTMHCDDPICEGAHGFPVHVHPATEPDPEDLDRDTCPTCGDTISDEPPAIPECDECGDVMESADKLTESDGRLLCGSCLFDNLIPLEPNPWEEA